jgi:hypothetical protein
MSFGQNDKMTVEAAIKMIPLVEAPDIIGDTSCPVSFAFSEQELQNRRGGRWTLVGDRSMGGLVYSGPTHEAYIRTILYKVKNDSLTEVYNEYGRFIGMDSVGFYDYNGACCCNEWNELSQIEWNKGNVIDRVFKYHRDTKIEGRQVTRNEEYDGFRRSRGERVDTLWQDQCTGEKRIGNTEGKYGLGFTGSMSIEYENARWLHGVQNQGDCVFNSFWTEKQLPVRNRTEVQYGKDKFYFRTDISPYQDTLHRFDYLQYAVIIDSVDLDLFLNQVVGVVNGYMLACGYYIDCYWIRDDSIMANIKINPFCRYYWLNHGSFYYTDDFMFDSLSISSYWDYQVFEFEEDERHRMGRMKRFCKGIDDVYMIAGNDGWNYKYEVFLYGIPNKIEKLRRKYAKYIRLPDSEWE